MTEIEKFINRINLINGIKDLENFTDNEIKSLINLGRVLIGTAILNKDHYVFRIRPNDKPLFYYEGDHYFSPISQKSQKSSSP